MGLLHLLIAALAPTVAATACGCVNVDQTIDPDRNPMAFFQQPNEGGLVNGVPCNMDCTFTANLDIDDPTKALQIQLLNNDLGDATIVVNGMESDIIITSNTPLGAIPQHSYGPSITADFKEGTTNNATFMFVVQKVDGRPKVVKSTTTAVPTPAYDTKFTHNPRLVANDIMFVFDISSDKIDMYKKFAIGIIQQLTINPKAVQSTDPEDCDVGSRLSNIGLSALKGFTTFTTPYWTASDVQAIGSINAMFEIATGRFFIEPLAKTYVYGFDRDENANDDEAYTLCKNRGKILIMLTSNSPSEFDTNKPTSPGIDIDFIGKGIHQILVQYKMDQKDRAYYNLDKNTDNRWNFFELTGTDKDVENFFNTYLVDLSDAMTCKLKSGTSVAIGEKGTGTTPPVFSVNIPPYYDGKKTYTAGTGPTGEWATPKHYCNFQDNTVQLVRHSSLMGVAGNVTVCLKVYYDLESGKDFVTILSGDPKKDQVEVVRLTGSDVSGTYFELPDAVGTIVFSSDEKNVYDGFHAEITNGKCP